MALKLIKENTTARINEEGFRSFFLPAQYHWPNMIKALHV